jgi:hypothetical protein
MERPLRCTAPCAVGWKATAEAVGGAGKRKIKVVGLGGARAGATPAPRFWVEKFEAGKMGAGADILGTEFPGELGNTKMGRLVGVLGTEGVTTLGDPIGTGEMPGDNSCSITGPNQILPVESIGTSMRPFSAACVCKSPPPIALSKIMACCGVSCRVTWAGLGAASRVAIVQARARVASRVGDKGKAIAKVTQG